MIILINIMNSNKFKIAETFVGCGGTYLGFKNNGFITSFVNDIWEDSMTTLKKNYKDLENNQIYLCDIKNLNKNLLIENNANIENLDVLFGGIVCCGFSMAGNRNPFDERNYLYIEQLRLVEELKPKISIIENVKGFISMKLIDKDNNNEDIVNEYKNLLNLNKSLNGEKSSRRKSNKNYEDITNKVKINNDKMKSILKNIENKQYNVFQRIIKMYNNIGYKVYHKVLNASDYGSYTKRERLIIIAVRNDIKKEYKFPNPTHSDIDDTLPNKKTLNNALNLLDANINSINNDYDNKPMNHNKKTIDRFKYIPEGKSIKDVVESLPKELKISNFYSRGNTQRLDRNKSVPTLVPGHSNFPIHPWEHRSITVREAALITGFPNDFKFNGSHTSRCIQIGNAVPVHLSDAIAKSIIQILE